MCPRGLSVPPAVTLTKLLKYYKRLLLRCLPISIGQTTKLHPYYIITILNTCRKVFFHFVILGLRFLPLESAHANEINLYIHLANTLFKGSLEKKYDWRLQCYITVHVSSLPTGICHGTVEIVPQEVLWSIWGSHQTLWSLPLPNVTWHSRTWPYTMTPSIDQTLNQFANLLLNWTLKPILTLLPNFGGFRRTLQRVRLANRGRLLLRTPGPVLFGTCICSNVETIVSWTCHVYGPFEFRTSLGTSILLLTYKKCLSVQTIFDNIEIWYISYICIRFITSFSDINGEETIFSLIQPVTMTG